MKNRKVVAHAQRLEVLFQRVDALDADPESIAHWSRYLCVLVSGFIEVSIRTILLDYADKRADPTVARFVGSHLRAFQNAKAGKILELLGRFGTDKRERLEQQLDGELRGAIDSVVANRHQIAHGQDVGIGFATIKTYFDSVKKAIELIEAEFA